MSKRWSPAYVIATGFLWATVGAADEPPSSAQVASNLLFIGCYFEATGFQFLTVDYMQGQGGEEGEKQIAATDWPEERKRKLIAAMRRIRSDKPSDYEEYGARIFLECAQQKGLQVGAERVSACFADSWVVQSAIDARTNEVPVEQVIAYHRDCQAFGCEDKGLDTKAVIEEVYAAEGSLDGFRGARFRQCVQRK